MRCDASSNNLVGTKMNVGKNAPIPRSLVILASTWWIFRTLLSIQQNGTGNYLKTYVRFLGMSYKYNYKWSDDGCDCEGWGLKN